MVNRLLNIERESFGHLIQEWNDEGFLNGFFGLDGSPTTYNSLQGPKMALPNPQQYPMTEK